MGTPHKHAEIIKAWADGAEIEVRYAEAINPYWHEWENIKEKGEFFQWREEYEFRIKPEPKPDVERYGVAFLTEMGIARVEYLDPSNGRNGNNIKLTFDGETGKLKAAEVLK